jgi:dienelactone hydrolase
LGERNEALPAFRTEQGPWEKSCQITSMVGLLLGKSLMSLRVWDVMRTIDYIHSRPESMIGNIGCVGLSGGGVVTLYAAALEDRIGVAVVSGALCTFRASIMAMDHCADNYVPGILRYAEAPDIAGLIAPRPLLIEHGIEDPLFPIPATRQAYQDLARVYTLLNCADHLEADYHAGAHRFSGGQAFTFLDRWLAEAAPHKR